MHRITSVGLPARIGLGLALGMLLIGLAGATSSKHAAAKTTTPQTTINCTLTIDAPHTTTSVPVRVKVITKWACSAPVASLSSNVQLLRSGQPVSQRQCSNTGQAALRCSTATVCVSGSYSGTVTGTVVYPPNFQPPSATLTLNSGPVDITC